MYGRQLYYHGEKTEKATVSVRARKTFTQPPRRMRHRGMAHRDMVHRAANVPPTMAHRARDFRRALDANENWTRM